MPSSDLHWHEILSFLERVEHGAYHERLPTTESGLAPTIVERLNGLAKQLGRMAMTASSLERAYIDLARQHAELERSSGHLVDHVYRDTLTGIGNRRRFDETLLEAMDAAEDGSPLGVFIIDLDAFKPVNDVHGHAAGDAVLIAVAARLVEVSRPDTVVCRLGGDEFALITTGREAPVLEALARDVAAAIAEPIPWMGLELHVSASIGVALTHRATAVRKVVGAADEAMYAAKRAGAGAIRMTALEPAPAERPAAELAWIDELARVRRRVRTEPATRPVAFVTPRTAARVRPFTATGIVPG